MIDRNDMPKLRIKMCELAEQVAAGFGVTLDYSERSVHDVERILGEIHDEYRRTKSEEGLQGLALEFGAYLVSVLEKHRGPVVWKRDHPEFGEDAFPLEWRGTTLFPVGWCLKRIVDGRGDDIAFKWKTLILNRDGEPAENGRRDNQPLQRIGAAKWFSWVRKLFRRGPDCTELYSSVEKGDPGRSTHRGYQGGYQRRSRADNSPLSPASARTKIRSSEA